MPQRYYLSTNPIPAGAQGPQGDQGPQGPTGAQGLKGDQGEQGNVRHVMSSVEPSENSTFDLGTAEKRWRNLYLGGSAINFSNGINFDSFDWNYLLQYVVPPKELENPAARRLFSGSPDGHAGFVASNKPYMFGRNNVGQLGLGDTTNRSIPTVVPGITDAVGIACGSNFTCVITSGGTAWAWGRNANGQLGDGTTTDRSSPVLVNGITTAIGVAAGQGHVLYLLANGTVVGYGSDANGQLGNGAEASSSVNTTLVPVSMPLNGTAIIKARFIACGAYYSLMLMENGSCYVFGANTDNQLGVGTVTSSSTPLVVPGISNVVSAACGESHTLLVRYNGEVLSCGKNTSGQCGVGSTAAVTTFTSIVSGTEFSSIGLSISVGAGTNHSIIALADGTVKVFGSNEAGQLGVGASVTGYTSPTTLNGYSAYSVACGKDYSFLLLKNSAVQTNAIVAFGNNVYGNMGDSQAGVTVRWIPNRIYDDMTTRKLVVSAHDANSMGFIETDGVAYACGINTSGQLGDGTTINTPTSKPISAILPRVAAMSFSSSHMIAIDGNGELWAAGNNGSGQLGDGTVINKLRPVRLTAAILTGKVFTSVACGQSHSAALDSLGAVYTWGAGSNGQLGDGNTTNRSAPVAVTGGAIAGKSIVSVQCGATHTVALDSQGLVYAWGTGTSGQLGDNAQTLRALPVLVNAGALSGIFIVAIACGQNHTMALSRDGLLYAWGLNTNGQVGDATTAQKNVPVAILGGSAVGQTFSAITCGTSHSLAIDSLGRIHAWGFNSSGQLGDSTVTQRISPGLSAAGGTLAGKPVIAIAGFSTHTAALASDGTIHTWGNNTGGKLGNGTETARLIPGLLTGISRDSFVKLVSEGYSGTHKLLMNRSTDGNKKILNVFGTNTYSQLGDGTNVDKFYAVTLPAFPYNIVSASNGNDHSGVVLSNGAVYMWGRNSVGQCGPLNAGTATNVSVPTALNGIGNATQVCCGDGFTLILLQDGTVMALGSNSSSKLGNTSVATTTYTSTPVLVEGLSAVTKIACGPNFSLACTVSGALWTWGSNVTGSTGLETTTGATPVPTQVSASVVNANGDRVIAVAAGETHAVIRVLEDITKRVKVFSAGKNLYGQLGRAASVFTSDAVSTFGAVSMGTTATPLHIACGQFHTIIHMSNLRAYTFGRNNATQLGFTGADRSAPYLMSDLDVTSVGTGTQNSYLEFVGSSILPYGTYYATIHSRVLANGFQEQGFIEGKKGGGSGAANHSAIVSRTGQLGMFGLNSGNQLGDNTVTTRTQPVWISNLGSLYSKRVVAAACGWNHTLVVDSLGKVHAFGTGSNGSIGDNANTLRSVPVEISAFGTLAGKFVVAVSAGNTTSYALDSTGGVHAWGINSSNQLGDSTVTQKNSAILTSGFGGLVGKFAVAVAAGPDHAMAIDSAGKVYGWGQKSYSRVGDGTNVITTLLQTTPLLIAPAIWTGKTIVAISCGLWHSAAIDSEGVVYAWGYNDYSQVGNGTQSVVATPIAITGGSLAGKVAVAISCGYNHTVALTSDGVVHTWGNNSYGQLGDGSVTLRNIPTNVTPLSSINKFVTSISTSQYATFATTSAGEVYAWGYNSQGELGDGTTTQRNIPTLTSTAALYSNFNQGTGTMPLFINFTGQHRVFVDGHAPRDLPRLEGLTVVSGTNSYMTTTRRGQAAITINESLPVVSLSSTANDKRAFGVISLSYNESPLAAEQEFQLQQSGDVRVHINSVGEGAMWVCDANGPLEGGDLITTSDVAGYGMRQDDDIMKSSTVAKITMTCDFSAPLVPVEELKKDVYGQNVLDSGGAPVWETVTETLEDGTVQDKMEPAYAMRYLDEDGAEISLGEYETLVTNSEIAFRAAFVGCTYHCG